MKKVFKRPFVGVGVIVIEGKKVLLGKRKGSHGSNTWNFPGGHLEFGESWEECAIREVFEETGMKVINVHFFAATNDIFKKEDKHYITIYMVCEYKSGEVEVKEPEKCETWSWFKWNNLPKPLFLPIKNLLKQKRHLI